MKIIYEINTRRGKYLIYSNKSESKFYFIEEGRAYGASDDFDTAELAVYDLKKRLGKDFSTARKWVRLASIGKEQQKKINIEKFIILSRNILILLGGLVLLRIATNFMSNSGILDGSLGLPIFTIVSFAILIFIGVIIGYKKKN